MAIACLRLFTVPPEPLLSVPLLRRRIADFTAFDAPRPYFLAMTHLGSACAQRRHRDHDPEEVSRQTASGTARNQAKKKRPHHNRNSVVRDGKSGGCDRGEWPAVSQEGHRQ